MTDHKTSSDANRPLWAAAMCDTRLTHAEYRTLSYLLWRQGGNHSAWPTLATIGMDLGMSESTVRRAIRHLTELGYLSVTLNPGRGKPNDYRCEKPVTHDTFLPEQRVSPMTGFTAKRVSPMTVKGVTHDTQNTIQEHSTKSKSSKRPFAPPSVGDVQAYAESRGDPDFEADSFVDYYTRMAWKRKDHMPVLDWKATVREWMKRNDARRIKRGEAPHDGYTQYGTHPATIKEAEGALSDS